MSHFRPKKSKLEPTFCTSQTEPKIFREIINLNKLIFPKDSRKTIVVKRNKLSEIGTQAIIKLPKLRFLGPRVEKIHYGLFNSSKPTKIAQNKSLSLRG